MGSAREDRHRGGVSVAEHGIGTVGLGGHSPEDSCPWSRVLTSVGKKIFQ